LRHETTRTLELTEQ